MFKPLYHVAVSYVTRPLVWLYVGVAGLSTLPLWLIHFGNDARDAVPALITPNLSVRFTYQLTEVVHDNRLAEVDALYLGADGLTLAFLSRELGKQIIVPGKNGGPALFFTAEELLARMPNLRIVDCYAVDVSPDLLQAIAKLPRLEVLSLKLASFDPQHLKYLAKVPTLREIDLSGCNVAAGIHSLTELPSLERLDFGFPNYVNNRLLGELSSFPHLRTLVLAANVGNTPQHFVSEKSVRRLADIRSLQTIYVVPTPNTDSIAIFRDLLPGVEIRRAQYSLQLLFRLLGITLVSFFLVNLLALQLMTIFGLPSSRMIPRFAAPQLLFVGSCFLFWLLLAPVFAGEFKTDALAVRSIVLAVTAFVTGIFAVKPKPSRVRGFILGLGMATLFTMGGVVAMKFGGWIDAYVRGDFPLLCWCLVLFSSLVIVRFAFVVRLAAVTYAELGIEPRSLADISPLGTSLQPPDGSPAIVSPGWRDSRLAAVLGRSRTGGGLWHRVAFWRVGNSIGWETTLVLMFVILLINGGQQIYFQLQFQRQPSVQLLGIAVAMVVATGLSISLAMAAVAWRQRFSLLAFESIHPVPRARMLHDLLYAVAVDLAMIPLLTVLAGVVLEVVRAGKSDWTPLEPWAAAVLVLGVNIAAYAVALWIITFRETWKSIAFSIGTLAVIVAAGTGTFAVLSLLELSLASGLFITGLGLSLASLVALRIAVRQWSMLELGLYSQ